MSYEAVRDVLHHYPHGGSRRLVLLVLAEHASTRTNICYPSIERIAAMACISSRQAKRCIADLADEGVIEVRRVRGRANVYRIRADVMQSFPPLIAEETEWGSEYADAFEPLCTTPPNSVDKPVDNILSWGHMRQVKGTFATGYGDTAMAPEPPRTRNEKVKNNRRAELESRFGRARAADVHQAVVGLAQHFGGER